MLKIVLIFLALAIVHQTAAFGLNKHWKNLIDYKLWRGNVEKLPLEHNQCVFFRGRGESKIACTSKFTDGYVECPAHFDFEGLDETVFHSFAIGVYKNDGVRNANSSVAYFDLFPRLKSSCFYMDNEIAKHGEVVRFRLYNSEKDNSLGVHVIEEDCFNSLVKLFTGFKHRDNIEIKSLETEKHNATKFSELYIL